MAPPLGTTHRMSMPFFAGAAGRVSVIVASGRGFGQPEQEEQEQQDPTLTLSITGP